MMKRKALGIVLLLSAMLLVFSVSLAASADPVVTGIEITPSKLTGPAKIRVTITVSNAGLEDLTDPVTLYDPAAQVVTDFGTDGSALLKAGETKTWTGTYEVNERTLDSGSVTYFLKYTLYSDSGKAVSESQPIMAKVTRQTAETDIEIHRYAPEVARTGQEFIVRYTITNTGTVNLTNITIQENKEIFKEAQTISVLKPGQTAEIKYPVTMAKKDLTSGATVTYTSETVAKKQTYKTEALTIKHGESSISASLTSSAKGVVENGTVTLKLTLKNTGNLDYSDIRVSDPVLGTVFSNQELKAGETLELEKEVTVPETMNFCFSVQAVDSTGGETAASTDTVTVTAVDPDDILELNVFATADKTEVFEKPGQVAFTVTVTNPSNVEAKDAVLYHGDTKIYTIGTIPAGETKSFTRNTALSMQGKYRFTVKAKDALDNELSFNSNDIQIAFSNPTPAPATPTPPPQPTEVPEFVPSPIPSRDDPSIAPDMKMIKSILDVALVVAGALLAVGVCLLVVSGSRRALRKKASEAAVDQLELTQRRDYSAPGEEPEDQEEPAPEYEADSSLLENVGLEEDYELPHMKYAREADPSSIDTMLSEEEAPSEANPQNGDSAEESGRRSRRSR